MKKRETIDFRHRAILLDSFRQMNLPISDYTFANIFLFRDVAHYEFLHTDCGLFIAGCNSQAQHYLMPLTDLRRCDQKTFDIILDKDNFLFPIPEEWLSAFPEDKFVITYADSESDYIYLTAKMASFKGKQYNRHRNHLNQFLSAYNHRVEMMSGKNVPQAMMILQSWQDDSGLTLQETDFEQCREALEKYTELALWGVVYYIEQKPAGFIIGEPLNTETFVLHFAKAAKKYNGIYELMFNDTAKYLLPSYKQINFEEDMGNEKLRQTKESYGPEMILKKYRVSLIR